MTPPKLLSFALTCEEVFKLNRFPFEQTCNGGGLDKYGYAINNAEVWRANDYCQQSCADAGFNYADPPCC